MFFFQRHQKNLNFPSLEINFWSPPPPPLFFSQLVVVSMGLALVALNCVTPNYTPNLQPKFCVLKVCESPVAESCKHFLGAGNSVFTLSSAALCLSASRAKIK